MISADRDTDVRLAVFASHPIQYHLPWYRRLAVAPGIELKVFFTLIPDAQKQGVGFDVPFTWDLPVLEGYDWELLLSAVRRADLDSFLGNRLRDAATAIGNWKPRAAILTGWQQLALVQVLRACRRLGIPCLVRGESNAMQPKRWPVRLIHRRFLRRFDAFLAIGSSNRRFYLDNGVAPDKIFRCPYFVDNERFGRQADGLASQRKELRAGWGIEPSTTCFLFAGKLIDKKRPLDLLEALGRAAARSPAIRLLIVGDGRQREEAQRMADDRKLPVTFTGFLNQTEMARAYVASDCLVLPSDYGETWGLVVNEAMACGRPAVVSDRVGCGPDLIEEGTTGYLFPFGQADALADRLLLAASQPDRLREMGGAARRKVTAEYSVEAAVAGTLAAVRSVLGAARSTG